MKHRVKGSKLSRDAHHLRALHKNLISAFITHGQIKTTQAKAKAVRPEIDRLMTKAKEGSVHSRRQIDAVLNQRKLVNRLVDELAPKTSRRSGFTRIVRLGRRQGDDAMMVRLEWVDVMSDEQKTSAKADAKKAATTSKTVTKASKSKKVTSTKADNKPKSKKSIQASKSAKKSDQSKSKQGDK